MSSLSGTNAQQAKHSLTVRMEEAKRAVRAVEDDAKTERSAILNASKVARSTFKLLEEIVLDKDTTIDALKWEIEMLKTRARNAEVGAMPPCPDLARNIMAAAGGGRNISEQFGNPERRMGSGDVWNRPNAENGAGIRAESQTRRIYDSSARGVRSSRSEQGDHAQDVFRQNSARAEQPGEYQGADQWMDRHRQTSPYARSSGGRLDGRDGNRRMSQSGSGQNKPLRSQPRGGPSDRYQTGRYTGGRGQPY